MSSLLRTERKYLQNYYIYLSQVIVLLILLLIFVVGAAIAWITRMDVVSWSAMFLLYLFAFYIFSSFLIENMENNENSYGTGYIVEEMVGTRLSALGDNFKVIHDIPTIKNNIDHVVVGPTGIFVIETKSNRNAMCYFKNGKLVATELAKKFIKQAAGNAYWVYGVINEKLGINQFVNGVVVRPLNNDRKINIYCSSRVCILDGEAIQAHIKSFDNYLSGEDIEKIYNYLCSIKRRNEVNNHNFIQKKLIAINLL